jgi:hypothetical protein
MAKIKKIYDDSARTTQVYPQTHEKAVIDNNGVALDSKLGAIVDMVNQKQMEMGAVPFDLEPTEGNTTHVVSSDVVARVDKNLSEDIDEAKELVNGKVSYVLRSDLVTTGADGENYMLNVNIVSGHKYKITMQSEAPLKSTGSTAVVVIVQSNGQQTVGTSDAILSGSSVQFTASSSGLKRIYQYYTVVAGVNVHMEIEDLSENPSIGPFNVESSLLDKSVGLANAEGVANNGHDKKILYTRSLANNKLTYNGLQPGANDGRGNLFYASMTNTLALPYRGVRIYMKAPDDIKARVIIRPWSESAAAINQSTIGDGEHIDAGAAGYAYVVEFNRRGCQLPPSEVTGYMDKGLLMLYYYDDSGNVTVRNSDELRFVDIFRGDGTTSNTNATFVHITDVHGDDVRMTNVLRFSNLIRSTATLVSGDIVAMKASDGIDYFIDACKKYQFVEPFICLGNHDINNVTDEVAYSTFIEPFAETSGWMKDAENVTDTCWFYKDLDSQKIRLISIDMFQYGRTSHYNIFYGQDQITWLINTLKSVPEGYAVLIVQHSMEKQAIAIPGHEEWWSRFPAQRLNYVISGGYVIQDIMDAWIGKTTINKTYSQPASGGRTNTFTANADFSDDAANEFIGYVCGHTHMNCIGYADGTTYRQLILSCTFGNALLGTDDGVYPRDPQGVTQDCFNVYSIDRTNKQVKIVKVGSNIKMDFVETKHTIVDYENVEN